MRTLYGPVHRPGPGRSGTADHPDASATPAPATRANRLPPTEAQAHAPRRTRRAGRSATPIYQQGRDLDEPLAQPGLGRAGGHPVPSAPASTPSGRASPRHVRTPHPAVRTNLADAPTQRPALPRMRHDPRRRTDRPADHAARGRSRPAATGRCRARASAGGTRWPARIGAPPVARRPTARPNPAPARRWHQTPSTAPPTRCTSLGDGARVRAGSPRRMAAHRPEGRCVAGERGGRSGIIGGGDVERLVGAAAIPDAVCLTKGP